VPRESTLNELVAEAAGKASYPLLISVSARKRKWKRNCERTTNSTSNRTCITTRNIIEGNKKKSFDRMTGLGGE
jgi:hypothetical protein